MIRFSSGTENCSNWSIDFSVNSANAALSGAKMVIGLSNTSSSNPDCKAADLNASKDLP